MDETIYVILMVLIDFALEVWFSYVLGAQKNHLIMMVLLSTHNKCFG